MIAWLLDHPWVCVTVVIPAAYLLLCWLGSWLVRNVRKPYPGDGVDAGV